MRYLIPLLMLSGCVAQQAVPPEIQYVARVVKDCSWIPQGTYSAGDTLKTKQWMIAYESARQTNCPSQ